MTVVNNKDTTAVHHHDEIGETIITATEVNAVQVEIDGEDFPPPPPPPPPAMAPPSGHTTSTSKTCTVISPSTLGEGYTFSAQVDGIDFIVTVPKGGVVEGQHFEVPYPTRQQPSQPSQQQGLVSQQQQQQQQDVNLNPPIIGRWRNDLCSCFEICCSSGMFWQAWCCLPLLLGQIMQRRKLNAIGNPTTTTSSSYQKTFLIVTIIWCFYLLTTAIASGNEDSQVNDYISILFGIYILIILVQTRYYYRQLYQIEPEPCCGCNCCNDDGRINDCCCSFWCSCCITIQMARHTHNQHQYPYMCCTETGLSKSAPEIV